ncbi:MAG: DUF2070 family protein [Candidatus Bathyarchaeia archaeon]
MTDEASLSQSIGKAKRHYSSLFSLPSLRLNLTILALTCLLAGALTSVLFLSVEGVAIGLLLGAAFFGLNLLSDLLLSRSVLADPIFVLRRTLALSFIGWLFWIAFQIPGAFLGAAYGFSWWVRLCLMGFACLLTLRTVVFLAVSNASLARRLTAILLQPFPCVVPFAAFWATQGYPPMGYVPFLVLSPVIACGFAYLFVSLLDRMGRKAYGTSSMSIFKAFLANWITGSNDQLEAFLERLGEDEDIAVSLLKFDSQKPKAAFIVPMVHPGPFKNVGSSLLPSMLKYEFQKKFGCDACVPLGLLGHELDAASQAQNHKIISQVLTSAKFNALTDKATPFVRVSDGFVAVSGQAFGKTALISFTLAPKTTEDLPQELGSIVLEEAKKRGFEDVIAINAHNSLTESVEIEASVEMLNRVAAKCLDKIAVSPAYPFEVGTASLYPEEFSLKDGMGSGGITAIVIRIAEQKTVYVVIDGNNMVSGLREKILSALTSAGFQESEVFTTDTHAVSAVVVGRRGYHPVGEAMNHEALIGHIRKAAETATGRLEVCRTGSIRTVVPHVRVIGGDCLSSLTVLVDRTIQRAKQIVAPVFALEGLLLVLLLAVV